MNFKLCFLLRPYHSRENVYVYLISQFLCFFMIFTFLLFFFPLCLKLLGSPKRLCDLAGPSSTEPESRKRSISKRKSHLDLLKLYDTFSFWMSIAWWRLLLRIFLTLFLSSWSYMTLLYEMWLCSNVPASQRRSLISVYCNHITLHILILT